MIISVEEIKGLVELSNWSDSRIERKLKSIEQTIRVYTNNNFQNRNIRAGLNIENGVALGSIPGLKTGDTIQISLSMFNNGLYVVTGITAGSITLDKQLTDEEGVLITKVEYPVDVVDCVVSLMDWEVSNRHKVGIKSETLSRHSVTYFDLDANNTINGYPAGILGCLKTYRKARC